MYLFRPQTQWFPHMYINSQKPWSSCQSSGFTLVELMIALTIMLVVSLAAVQLSASVFGTNTQLIHMTQLTSELRSAIQIISRDVRRAGYDSDALAGFLTTEEVSSGVTMGDDLDDTDDDYVTDCLRVAYDDISSGDEVNAVYRLRTISGIGRVSVHYGDSTSCDTLITDGDWVDMSDPLLINITALQFVHNEDLTDIAENLNNGHMIQVGLEQVSITISATLRDRATVNRSITNEVQIRNQFVRI
jgi:prepilin peptidase dependent protein B